MLLRLPNFLVSVADLCFPTYFEATVSVTFDCFAGIYLDPVFVFSSEVSARELLEHSNSSSSEILSVTDAITQDDCTVALFSS